MRIYTKPKCQIPDYEEPVVLHAVGLSDHGAGAARFVVIFQYRHQLVFILQYSHQLSTLRRNLSHFKHIQSD